MAQPAKLTPKQQRFVDEYLIDLNATQAAIRAGYSVKTARQIGSRLLSVVVIRAAIKAHGAKVTEQSGLTLIAHLDALNRLREDAAGVEQYSAAVAAEVSRGKASGFYIDKHEHRHAGAIQVRVRIEREGRRVTAS